MDFSQCQILWYLSSHGSYKRNGTKNKIYFASWVITGLLCIKKSLHAFMYILKRVISTPYIPLH